jgi:hypothetical protein
MKYAQVRLVEEDEQTASSYLNWDCYAIGRKDVLFLRGNLDQVTALYHLRG